MRHGLVLTGGGARGAYQAGALLGIAEITGAHELPFSVVTGTSAGSINAAFLMARADDFQGATRALCDLWATLKASDVFRTDVATLSSIGARWLTDLALGGFIGSGRAKSLLDTSPLRTLLEENVDSTALAHVLDGGARTLALTATNYHSGIAITFYQGARDLAGWTRTGRMGARASLGVQHVLASSAIPVFFPPVEIDGAFYADGCIRLGTPFSPAIHLGADRALAIGTRHRSREADPFDLRHGDSPLRSPSHADVGGTLLNAVFLDAIDGDFERVDRINRTLALIPPDARSRHELRLFPATLLLPSTDLGAVAAKAEAHLPLMLRHLMKGLGVGDGTGWDLLSYLAFDEAFTSRLVGIGFEDAKRSSAAIENFFSGS